MPTGAIVVGTALVAVALAAAAGGIAWGPGDGEVVGSSARRRALLGALAGFAVAAAALAATRAWRRRHAVPRRAVASALLIATGVGAITGVATADREEGAPPTSRRDAELPPPVSVDPSDPIDGAGYLVDADGDGRADLDAAGNVQIAFDANGDGIIDGVLVPCDTELRPPARRDVVVIDLGCDGRIDGRIHISDRLIQGAPRPGAPVPGREPTAAEPDPGGPDAPDPPGEERSQSAGPVLATLLAIAVLIAIAALAIRSLLRARSALDAPPERGALAPPVDAAAADAALASSIDRLLADPDPRVAIRAAYAALLDALAEVGFARRDAETPDAHLRRCLEGLAVEPAPLRELLELFVVARFSTHPVGEEHRAAALAALRRARTTLGAERIGAAR